MFLPHDANRIGLDYRKEAGRFSKFPFPVVDAHMHLHNAQAAVIYKEAARLYGVTLTYAMTHLENIPSVKEVLGNSVRFIAMPRFTEEEQFYTDLVGYMNLIDKYYNAGARIIKFWAAPRGIDIGRQVGKPDLLRLDTPRRLEIMKQAASMGMIFMTHVGDPDTWFHGKYRDTTVYGRKSDYYSIFEQLLNQFTNPWIAAHMGGWPEDLEFLSGILKRHANLYLDTSATKWMVRELSKHSREDLKNFLIRWKGRILFGSDIVVKEENLLPDERHLRIAGSIEARAKEIAKEEAFELYASRYWALRTLFETDYNGPSPISDPDLALIEPAKYSNEDAPILKGKSLPLEILENLYFKAADSLLDPVFKS